MAAIASLHAKPIGSGQVPDMRIDGRDARRIRKPREALEKKFFQKKSGFFKEAEDLLEYDNLDAVGRRACPTIFDAPTAGVKSPGKRSGCVSVTSLWGLTIGACGRMVKKSTGNRKSAGSDDEPAHVPQASVVKRCSAERPVRGAETGKLDHHGLVSDRQLLPVGRMADILEAGRRRRIV